MDILNQSKSTRVTSDAWFQLKSWNWFAGRVLQLISFQTKSHFGSHRLPPPKKKPKWSDKSSKEVWLKLLAQNICPSFGLLLSEVRGKRGCCGLGKVLGKVDLEFGDPWGREKKSYPFVEQDHWSLWISLPVRTLPGSKSKKPFDISHRVGTETYLKTLKMLEFFRLPQLVGA